MFKIDLNYGFRTFYFLFWCLLTFLIIPCVTTTIVSCSLSQNAKRRYACPLYNVLNSHISVLSNFLNNPLLRSPLITLPILYIILSETALGWLLINNFASLDISSLNTVLSIPTFFLRRYEKFTKYATHGIWIQLSGSRNFHFFMVRCNKMR